MIRIKEKVRKAFKLESGLMIDEPGSTPSSSSSVFASQRRYSKWKKFTSLFRRKYSTFSIFSTSCCIIFFVSLCTALTAANAENSITAFASPTPLRMKGVIKTFAKEQYIPIAPQPIKTPTKVSMAPAFSQRLRTAERSMNRISLLGRVGGDPEIRALPSGEKVATFSLATSESWRDKISGDIRVRTEWHRVCVYDNSLCEIVEKFIKKGRRIFLEGTLQSRRYTTHEGYERSITEVILPRYRGELILLENPEDRNEYTGANSAEENTASFFPAADENNFTAKRSSGGGLYNM